MNSIEKWTKNSKDRIFPIYVGVLVDGDGFDENIAAKE